MTDIHFENSVLKHKTGPIIIIEEKTKKKNSFYCPGIFWVFCLCHFRRLKARDTQHEMSCKGYFFFFSNATSTLLIKSFILYTKLRKKTKQKLGLVS